MSYRTYLRWRSLSLLACLLGCLSPTLLGQTPGSSTGREVPADAEREGAWLRILKDGYSQRVRTIELTAKAEAKPALKHKLLPQPFDMVDGNAAVHYLNAIGFAEQTLAREAMLKFEREARRNAGADSSQPAPYSWLETLPNELPLEEVKEYLSYTAWQKRFLEQAWQREKCDFDRNIRSVENPVGFLLPEIQSMRQLARLQSMRFRLAIAENQSLEAFKILGQQFALARHLSQEPFLVSTLVGIACASIGINDAYYLSEQKDSPNMYWALTALPSPLVSLREAHSYEREFLFEQFKEFRRVDEVPQPASLSKQIVDDLATRLEEIRGMLPGQVALGKTQLATLIATSYPGAKAYLVNEAGMANAKLDKLPNTQVVLLAMRRVHEMLRDEFFKLQYLPNYQRKQLSNPNEILADTTAKYGLITSLSALFLPAIEAASSARDRLESQVCMLRIVESLRDHLATHQQLPESLDDLRLPAPVDPWTGAPFRYKLDAGEAALESSIIGGNQVKLILVPASQPETQNGQN